LTTTLDNIVADVTTVVSALAPIAETLDPALAPAIAIGTKIVQGVLATEPTAVALYNQLKAGTPPTAAQLTQFQSAYESAYQKLNADIAAKLAGG
jgi:hypothetical protein